MDALLERVLDAHGGLEAWSKATRVSAELSLDGPFWDWRGQPSIRRRQTVTLDPRREHISVMPLLGEDTTAVFDAERDTVEIRSADGTVLHHRDKPRSSFPAYTDDVQWDESQIAYFVGMGNWNYLVEPYLFTYPGVQAREIEPWQENGETWRQLAVQFPANLPNHNPHQTFYYGPDYLLRRMDYAPDLTGDSPIAHYPSDPRFFDGFVFYTRRVVHLRDADGNADPSLTPITITLHSATVESSES
jgi:hypothetical protein